MRCISRSQTKEKRPLGLKWRSSKGFIGITACVAAFTEGFLNSAIVPVLPFSLVERSGVSEDDVQYWLSLLLVVFGVSMTIAAPFAGWITDLSASRQAPFLGSLILAFVSTLFFCFGTTPALLVVARLFQGVSGSIIYTAGLALVADTVRSDEVGSWIGFVFSGMTMGNLLAPWLAGIVYEKAGYYAVFAIILAIIALDFILRVVMIEKRNAAIWLPVDKVVDFNPQKKNPGEWSNSAEQDTDVEEHGARNRERSGHVNTPRRSPSLPDEVPCQDETSALLPRNEKSSSSWLSRTFPRVTLLLRSPRILAAMWGAFCHAMLIAFLDATLPVFVKMTFHWESRGAGLIFIACSVPSLLGTPIGMLSDRFGTRKVAAVGFAMLVPCLALLGVVKHNNVVNIVILCFLLVIIGTGLNAILSPLAADMFHEVAVLAKNHPDVFGDRGAVAQAYSLFNGAFGVAVIVGAAVSGALYDNTNWQITCGVMASLTALVALLVLRSIGGRVGASEPSDDERLNC